MRRGEVVREGLRNLRAHPTLTAVTFLVIFVIAGGAILASVGDLVSISNRQEALVAQGSNVWNVTTAETEGLSASRCDSLNAVDGVKTAGAVLSMTYLESAIYDSEYVAVQIGTPGLVGAYWPSLGNGIAYSVVGATVASRYGLVDQSQLILKEGPKQSVFTVVPAASSPRGAAYDQLLLEIAPASGSTRECIVEASPGHRRSVEALLIGWFRGTEVVVSPYIQLPEGSRLPQNELAERLSAWFAPAAAVFVNAAIIGSWLMRRQEFALYALLGLKAKHILLMLLVEFAVLVVLPICMGVVTALLILHSSISAQSTVEGAIFGLLGLGSLACVAPAIGIVALRPRKALERLRGN